MPPDRPAAEGGGGGGRRLLIECLRQQWRGVAIGVVVGLVWTAAKVSVPKLAQLAIDRGILKDEPGELARWSLLIVAVGIVVALTAGSRRWLAFRVSRRVEADLRSRLFAHLVRLPFSFHDRTPTGQLMARANTDLQQIQFFLVMIPITLSNAVTVVAVTAVLLSIDVRLTVIALAALPLVNVLARRFSHRLHPAVRGLQEELAELAEVVEETVSGIRVVKGHGAEALQSRRLRAEADDVFDRSVETARVRAAFLPAMELLPTLGLVAVLWFGGRQVLDGGLALGELVAFNAYLLMLVWPLRSTGLILALASRAAAAADRVDEVLSTEPTIADRPGAVALPPRGVAERRTGEVRFESVTFGYSPAAPVLEDLDLVVHAGESVALVGPTAAGKSTIARLLPRYYEVDRGRIVVDGLDVRALHLHDLRRAVGVVFEDTFLFSQTVRETIAYADPDAPFEVVERAARLAGAKEFVEALPEGYETLLGERGFSLSGGQRQRLAIARAILADPRILVLDDATSAVDPTKEHEIRDALDTVMRGRTTLVIAHRPAVIALAGRVVLIDRPEPGRGARVIAEGTHHELLETSERYREVLAAAAVADGRASAGTGAEAEAEVGS